MKYFTFFPTFQYKFSPENVVPMMDIFIKQEAELTALAETDFEISRYFIEDGETPDKISKDFYGSSQAFWYILLTNNIIDIYSQWPVSYNLWKQNLSDSKGTYTLYTPYKMDIKRGDIVAKYDDALTIVFDKDNFGIVTEVDPVMRSFDVDFVKGEIKEQDNIIILRKNNSTYSIIKTPDDSESQVLKKIQLKLDSAILFLGFDQYSNQKVQISPYKIYGTNQTISSKINDVTNTNCVLDKFLSNTLPGQVTPLSFLQDNENKFIPARNIGIVSSKYLPDIADLYLKALST